jgi:competence protein ComEA
MKILLVINFLGILLCAGVDINTANITELISLKGIGKKKAERIIEYRNKKCFKTINELINVKGIGNNLLNKNMQNLEISDCNITK